MTRDITICNICGQRLKPQVCKDNSNGNAGRYFVQCISWPEGHLGPGTGGEHTKYFRFFKHGAQPPPPPPTQPEPTTHAANGFGKCRYPSCNASRPPARDCVRQMCKRQCLELGGCVVHYQSGRQAPPFQPPTPPPPPASPPPPRVAPARAPATTSPTPPPTTRERPPRYATHIPQIFTQQQAQQQQTEATRRALHVSTQANAILAKHVVRAFGWNLEGAEPTLFDFSVDQWPYFVLSAEVLKTLGLLEGFDTTPSTFRMYDEVDEIWVGKKVDHVVHLQDGQRVYIRLDDVKECLGFDKFFDTGRKGKIHMRENLAGERADVKKRYRLKEQQKQTQAHRRSSRSRSRSRTHSGSLPQQLPATPPQRSKSQPPKAKVVIKDLSSSPNYPPIQTIHTQQSPARKGKKRKQASPDQIHVPKRSKPAAIPSRHRHRHHPPSSSSSDIVILPGPSKPRIGEDISNPIEMLSSDDSPIVPAKVKVKTESEVKVKTESEVKVKIEPGIKVKAEVDGENSGDEEDNELEETGIEDSGSSDDSDEGSTRKMGWPYGYYCVDIAQGLRAIKKRNSRTISQVFEAYFQTTYNRQRYYNTQTYWKSVSSSVREKFVEAGHSSEGTWDNFMKARQRLARKGKLRH